MKYTHHLNISLNSGDTISLTPEHLLISENGNLRCADTFQLGEKLFDGSIISNISVINDIPLTPILLSGKIMLPNSSKVVVSCWAQSTENATNMDKLMSILIPYTKQFSVSMISNLIHGFYTEFVNYGKNMNINNINKVIKKVENKYSINNNTKQLVLC